MERLRGYAYLIFILLGGGVLAYLALRYLFPVALPFLLAWAIAFLVRPLAAKISGGRARGWARATFTLIITVGIFALLGVAVWQLLGELWHLVESLGEGDALAGLMERLSADAWLPDGILNTDLGEQLSEAIYRLAMSLVTSLGSAVSGWVGAIPRALLFIVITVIASVYFSLELETVNSAVRRLLPERLVAYLVEIKDGFFSVGVRYIRSYLLLMLITFVTMLTGLLILRSPYALLLSLIIAVLDLLPVIGVGTVLVPWSIFSFILGNKFLGVGLIILLAVHELIRQLAEPKILGKNIGVHPILTLVLLYSGYALFGLGGILLVPIVTVILRLTLGKKNAPEVDESATAQ